MLDRIKLKLEVLKSNFKRKKERYKYRQKFIALLEFDYNLKT